LQNDSALNFVQFFWTTLYSESLLVVSRLCIGTVGTLQQYSLGV